MFERDAGHNEPCYSLVVVLIEFSFSHEITVLCCCLIKRLIEPESVKKEN